MNVLILLLVPGFSENVYTLAKTDSVLCRVCERYWGSSSMHQLLVGQYAMPGSGGSIERSWGSSSMHQLLVGQYAMPGSVGSIAHGCWSLPPMADGQACVLPPGANGECSFTLIGRPVFMSTFSAQFVVTYL